MKLPFFTILNLLVFYPLGSLSAQSPAPMPGAEQVGVAAAVRGGVQLARGGAVGHVVESGESVYLEDAVTTDAKGALQILLLDETAFTIGPNSAIVINRFVYDPSTGAGKVDARIVKGTFRFITGKIARKKPEDMTIALPAGTIGIRGTMAMGSVQGERSLVVLTGPGKQNTTGSKKGELVVSNEEGNEKKTVNLTKTGYGTVIEGAGKGPSDPFEVPEAQLAEMTDSLSPEGEGGGEEGVEDSESATEQAGQDQVDAGDDVSGTESAGDVSRSRSEESARAAQNAANSGGIQDGIARIQDLLTIQTGVFHYDQSSVALFNTSGVQVGSYNITLNIDFGSKRIGGGSSSVSGRAGTIDGNDDFEFLLTTAQSFSDGGSGSAIFTFSGLTDSVGGIQTDAQGTLRVALNNSGGVVAATATHSLTALDAGIGPPSTTTGSGTAPQSVGLG